MTLLAGMGSFNEVLLIVNVPTGQQKIRRISLRKRLSRRLFEWMGAMSPSFALSRRRKGWATIWEIEKNRPESELATALPKEIIDAVESQWIAPGSKILDIGSGRGQISAWLAERGFDVVGADLSEEATLLAKKHFGHLDSVEFKTVDMCADSLSEYQFDVLIDRGCLHGMPDKLRLAYARNILTCTQTGARFIVLHRAGRDSGEIICQKFRALFGKYFEIVDDASSIEPMIRSTGRYPRRQDIGHVVKMIRK
jgi:cyclopropane fatty-acyl-phospholipid synthase-like methyltransferase